MIKNIYKNRKNNNFNLLILGDGEEKEKLLKIIKKRLEEKVFLLGHKKNIYNYLYNSNGLICTSLWEEPGFVIQEAACKKIIVTSNCDSGPSEFLQNGKYGFVYQSENSKSFIKTFNAMLKNKNRHNKMIYRNYKEIMNYTKQSFVRKINKELCLFDGSNKI